MKFDIRFDGPSAVMMKVFGLGPRSSSLEVGDDTVQVHMGWGFRATIPRASITAAAPTQRRPLNRGVHGWRGRWLVNGSGKGLVTVTIDPPVRAATMGWPVQLRELTVSVDAPDELVEALAVG